MSVLPIYDPANFNQMSFSLFRLSQWSGYLDQKTFWCLLYSFDIIRVFLMFTGSTNM